MRISRPSALANEVMVYNATAAIMDFIPVTPLEEK
jgi:hypothetical protein